MKKQVRLIKEFPTVKFEIGDFSKIPYNKGIEEVVEVDFRDYRDDIKWEEAVVKKANELAEKYEIFGLWIGSC